VIFVENGEGRCGAASGGEAVTKQTSDQRGKAVAEVAHSGAKVVLSVLGARSIAAEAELLDCSSSAPMRQILRVEEGRISGSS